MSHALDQSRKIYDAFEMGDMPGVLSVFSRSIAWTEMHGGPYGGDFEGPDAVLENVFMKIAAEWDAFAALPARFLADGDTVIVLGEYSATCKATGKLFTAPFAHAWSFENDRAVTFDQYTDTAAHL